MSLQTWICLACKAILGYVEDNKQVRIKRKDLYVEFEGGKITTNCLGCGRRNTLHDEPDLNKNAQIIELKEKKKIEEGGEKNEND